MGGCERTQAKSETSAQRTGKQEAEPSGRFANEKRNNLNRVSWTGSTQAGGEGGCRGQEGRPVKTLRKHPRGCRAKNQRLGAVPGSDAGLTPLSSESWEEQRRQGRKRTRRSNG